MDTPKKKAQPIPWKLIVAMGFFIFMVMLVLPIKSSFPYTLTIEKGDTVSSVSADLYAHRVIRSRFIFESTLIVIGGEKRITEGDYLFAKPISVFDIAFRIASKNFGVERVRFTIPEGTSRAGMANIFAAQLKNFNKEKFMANTKEGYLFPDTYFIFPSRNENDVIQTMTKNFNKKIATIQGLVVTSDRDFKDIMIMASIIEKESSGNGDRAIISGILWKRLDRNMLLQVDAPFLYILGKDSSQLTRADLQIKSPYNTYVHKGLPPAPITNPGLESIKAALSPQDSPYFYYLHGSDGKAYYAVTFAEHIKNRKYLK